MKKYYIIFSTLITLYCNAQKSPEYLTKIQIQEDITLLDEILQNTSSYQGLNGYEYKKDFDVFLANTEAQNVTKYNFQLFLSKTIGKIGDRHSYIKGDRSQDSLYLPMAFAPLNDNVVVLDYDRNKKEFSFWNMEFPYLKSINKIPIEKLLYQILPEDILAPKEAHTTRAVRELRDIENVFNSLNIDLPNPLPITLVNENNNEKSILIDLVKKDKKGRLWDERFKTKLFFLPEVQFNEPEIIEQCFSIKSNIAYIKIFKMLDSEESPLFFKYLPSFMQKIKKTDALIIDVRDNGGGSRDLIQELASFIVHPDSLYVVNAARQRGELPLNNELKERLHNRYLFSKNELDFREQNAVDSFMIHFKPMYNLDSYSFSDYYYYVLNGQKITNDNYRYNKPIYILANERSFSAASILVSVFKGLPNIKIVGVNTDGSSGNSQRFELPNSGLKGKISTMVSFQKNGQVLDGIGTAPDIIIERNLDQIFFKEDYQLNELNRIIITKI